MKTDETLIFEAATKEHLRRIAQCAEVAQALKFEFPEKRNPLMILYDVTSRTSNDDLMETIYKQNFASKITKKKLKISSN